MATSECNLRSTSINIHALPFRGVAQKYPTGKFPSRITGKEVIRKYRSGRYPSPGQSDPLSWQPVHRAYTALSEPLQQLWNWKGRGYSSLPDTSVLMISQHWPE